MKFFGHFLSINIIMNNKCRMVDYIDANVKASGIFGTFVWQGINGADHSIDPPPAFLHPHISHTGCKFVKHIQQSDLTLVS